MSKELYESLFNPDHHHEGTNDLVATFARMGRIRKAAYDLANDEMHEGTWATEIEDKVTAARFAAEDRSAAAAVYSGGGYRVRVECIEETWTVLQLGGPPGASLKLEESWIVLQPGQTTELPVQELPKSLTRIDWTGLEITLSKSRL